MLRGLCHIGIHGHKSDENKVFKHHPYSCETCYLLNMLSRFSHGCITDVCLVSLVVSWPSMAETDTEKSKQPVNLPRLLRSSSRAKALNSTALKPETL